MKIGPRGGPPPTSPPDGDVTGLGGGTPSAGKT
jgi:hypothetical protein